MCLWCALAVVSMRQGNYLNKLYEVSYKQILYKQLHKFPYDF